jgi:hypothetical protein
VPVATWETVCEIAATLPSTEPGVRLGAPVWRTNGKVIVQLGGRLRVPGEDEIVKENGELIILRVADDSEREALLQAHQDTFFVTPHYEGSRDVLVWLRKATKAQLRELVTEACRSRLTKSQLRQHLA